MEDLELTARIALVVGNVGAFCCGDCCFVVFSC